MANSANDSAATRRFPRSTELYERACRVIPGGVNSPVRAFRAVGGTPLFITRGSGQHLTDVDGHSYLDFVGSWGALILDRKSTRLNSSHVAISYAVFCL